MFVSFVRSSPSTKRVATLAFGKPSNQRARHRPSFVSLYQLYIHLSRLPHELIY
jgi:hypothetical protein